MLVTKKWIEYKSAPYGEIVNIPAGVPVIPANNLPAGELPRYWVEAWAGLEMDEKAESWHRNYGFLVDANEVTDSPFTNGQRVRIKPCKHYPPTKAKGGIRYGIIQGATQHPGMCLIDKDRPSNAGEWAYSVASYHSPNAGALWFSAEGLEAMERP